MKLFQFVLCALTCQASYQAVVKERIFHGNEAVEGQFPYQVQLFGMMKNKITGDNSIYGSCGGSLISSKHVLTAAHCLLEDGSFLIEVAMAFGSIESKEQELENALKQSKQLNENIQVCNDCWILYPGYRNEYPYWGDIAIINLPRRVKFTDTIKPVKLPSWSNTEWELIEKTALVAGWGRTQDSNHSETLLFAPFTITDNSECPFPRNHLKDKICIKHIDERTPCQGDNGSPLVVDNKQVGIVSYGPRDCVNGEFMVYTSVISFLGWIWENTGLRIDNY